MTQMCTLPQKLALPVIASPMFLVSTPALVVAQCCAGIVGSFPALNARPQEVLDAWLTEIEQGLAACRAADPVRVIAPYAVNLIVHQSNPRLQDDLETCIRHRVPIIITSLHSPDMVVERVHAYGGIVLHDVTTVRHAKKALAAGVDGLILVCAGAGGHSGTLSPFALVAEVRAFYDGLLVLAGSITSGAGILAAQALGCQLAYMGTRFIASTEASAAPAYKQMVVDASAADILLTPCFSGVSGNYLKPSIRAAGLDPDLLPAYEPADVNFTKPKKWKDIWGCGQGAGNIHDILPAADIVRRLKSEYKMAREQFLSPSSVL
ncbi:nitronate monooxygenase family protein [Herbaspirillum sp. RTI4]|uniref:NAD(P)H-dependent flavin oxidoreductase n=1 Tax=Herbaspirillum sp. RTI4 TaxID=3048640 RepID=UPI002AB4172E|nr:nitronate monooxygenase family protein [Herbaspirillum sp. RTI4]MDY7579740.1 nitronate monooxygenase family protein [Herbaspirillum sp. RTI4]MEA9982714.1 nitronate monooxygenase family protein [Herbaspirillum sp. RTI4]